MSLWKRWIKKPKLETDSLYDKLYVLTSVSILEQLFTDPTFKILRLNTYSQSFDELGNLIYTKENKPLTSTMVSIYFNQATPVRIASSITRLLPYVSNNKGSLLYHDISEMADRFHTFLKD